MRFVLLFALILSGCLTSPSGGLFEGPPSLAERIVWPEQSVLTIEIHHLPGYAPSAAVLERTLDVLRTETGKTTIRVDGPTEVSGATNSERVWSLGEVQDFDSQTASWGAEFSRSDEVRLHMLFLDGRLEIAPDEYAVGVQFGKVIGIWPDPLRELRYQELESLPLRLPNPSAEQAISATVVHELGHAMGLVGRGAPVTNSRPAPIEDDPCQCHSANRDSVMYPAVERFNPERYLAERRFVVDTFDADDRADLAALRASY